MRSQSHEWARDRRERPAAGRRFRKAGRGFREFGVRPSPQSWQNKRAVDRERSASFKPIALPQMSPSTSQGMLVGYVITDPKVTG